MNTKDKLREEIKMTTKEKETKKEVSKRVEVVSLKVVKEKSIQYLPRKVSSPQDAVDLCRKFLNNLPEERMISISLNTKNEFNNVTTVSIGTLNSSLAHPREIYKVAVMSNASSIIIAHNHPSGNPDPSKEDIDITKRLKEAGEILGIRLLDHIIIGEEARFVSLKEMDIL